MKKFIFFILCLGICLAICKPDGWGAGIILVPTTNNVPGNKNQWTYIIRVKSGTVIKIAASGKVDFGCSFPPCVDDAMAGVTGMENITPSGGTSMMMYGIDLMVKGTMWANIQSVDPSNMDNNKAKMIWAIYSDYFGKTHNPNYDEGGVWIKIVKAKDGTPYLGTQLYYFWGVDKGINTFGLPIIEDVDVYAKAHDGGRSPDATKDYGDNKGAYSVQVQIVRTWPTAGSVSGPGSKTPVPAPVVNEDCVSFNPNTTTLANIQGRLKIVDGNNWLFDFGNNQAAADRALTVIKFYKMNRLCFVGRPQPPFTYLTVGANAPAGTLQGEDCIPFNPAAIQVQDISGRWKIVQGTMWMYDFASNMAEAEQALSIIKKYGFTHQCFVGRPNPPFQYLHR